MARIKINHACNVLTGDDSHAYRSPAHPTRVRPEITVPEFRARLSVADARALAENLMEAVAFAEGMIAEDETK